MEGMAGAYGLSCSLGKKYTGGKEWEKRRENAEKKLKSGYPTSIVLPYPYGKLLPVWENCPLYIEKLFIRPVLESAALNRLAYARGVSQATIGPDVLVGPYRS
jgi:hypothetical protein